MYALVEKDVNQTKLTFSKFNMLNIEFEGESTLHSIINFPSVKKLFKARRVEQLEAVKKIRQLPEDKQTKMLKSFTKTLFDVILKSKVVLENSGYVAGVSDFPESEDVRDALSLVLENTALMGEVALRLPELAETVLRSTPEWSTVLGWSLGFVNQTGLLDQNTVKLINLVSQELNLTSRTSDFINPYRKVNSKVPLTQEKEVKKKKKRAEQPRGPRLTLRQSGEL